MDKTDQDVLVDAIDLAVRAAKASQPEHDPLAVVLGRVLLRFKRDHEMQDEELLRLVTDCLELVAPYFHQCPACKVTRVYGINDELCLACKASGKPKLTVVE